MRKRVGSLNANEILELVFAYLAEVSSLQDYDEILHVLARMGKALTSADRCSVWIVSDDRKTVWTKVVHGVESIEVPIDFGIIGSSIVTGERLIIDDVYKDKRFNQEIDKQTGYKTKSMLVIPMYNYSDTIIGAFQVINHQGESDIFNTKDMERLALASTYAAETIISAQLTQKIEERQKNEVKVLGAYGTKAKNCGTSSIYLNSKNVIDAGNLLLPLETKCLDLENIWITHAHLDHIVDIASMMDTYFSLQSKPLNLLGLPKTLESIQKNFLNNEIWPDFSKIQLNGKKDMAITYTEIEVDKEYILGEEESLKAIKTDHTVESCGYIYTKGKSSFLVTQDTYSLKNIIEELNKNLKITAAVIECSFPNEMEELAQASKHLTPKLLFKQLESLKREDINLYINHIKPVYLNKIMDEIELYKGEWKPVILKDGDFVSF